MSGYTQFGFEWGPMSVERWTHIEGRGYVLCVRTDRAELQIYVSEKGWTINPGETRPRTRPEPACLPDTEPGAKPSYPDVVGGRGLPGTTR